MQRKNCLVCDSHELVEIINLGSHPFADTFVPESKASEADAVYPLVCDLCKQCGHVQTRYETDPALRYSGVDYSYTSSNSTFATTHWNEYAHELTTSLKLQPGALVIDVGSNDGYLPEQFAKQGLRVLGVDPSDYMAELAKKRGVDTRVGLFGREVAEQILATHGQADLVTANNVFNHANNPLEFVKAVAALLKPTGSFVFEQPYWLTSIESGKFDQIYHEHVSYFSVRSLKTLLGRAGLAIKEARVVDYHGGSLRIIAQKKEKIVQEPDHVRAMIATEEAIGLFTSELYANFMHKNRVQRNRFMQRLYKLKEEGHSIIAVGAPAKGNTFLNFYGLNNTLIDYVTDSSPHKQGKYTPATRIPIVSDDIFSKYGKVYALVLSWNIADQLKKALAPLNQNIEFISPDGC